MKERAQILDTGVPLFFKAQLEINAPAQKIFDFISYPANHQLMMVQEWLEEVSGEDLGFILAPNLA